MSQAEFSAFIRNLIDENVFRALSNPYYFTSLPWKDQRAFLSQMVGNITNEEIADNDGKFTELLKALAQVAWNAIAMLHISKQQKNESNFQVNRNPKL